MKYSNLFLFILPFFSGGCGGAPTNAATVRSPNPQIPLNEGSSTVRAARSEESSGSDGETAASDSSPILARYTRADMNAELKRTVIPALREMGFKGSMPHFYRLSDTNHVDLVTIQFASSGGSFVVELGYADPARDNVYLKKETPANKLRVSQTRVRRRLGAKGDSGDFWFSYTEARHVGMTGAPPTLAETVRTRIQTEAVSWWNAKQP